MTEEKEDDGYDVDTSNAQMYGVDLELRTSKLVSGALDAELSATSRKAFVEDTISFLVSDASAREQLAKGMGMKSGKQLNYAQLFAIIR